MHGLCTFGFVGRAVLRDDVTATRRSSLLSGVDSHGPAIPGEPLETRMWKRARQILFTTSSGSGQVLSGGYATRR